MRLRAKARINLKWWRVGIGVRVGTGDEVRVQGLGSRLGLRIRGVGTALGLGLGLGLRVGLTLRGGGLALRSGLALGMRFVCRGWGRG